MYISLLRPLLINAGWVSQWFGANPSAYARFGLAGHNGIDYAVPEGTSVFAAHDGEVVTGNDPKGYGLYVKVRGPEYETLYGHLSEIVARPNLRVKQGALLGYTGNTGNSTGPHLHFGLRVYEMDNPAYSDWIDPVPFRDI